MVDNAGKLKGQAAAKEKADNAAEEKKEQTIVVFNKSKGRFTIKTDLASGKQECIEPEASKSLPESQAKRLLKMYPKELVDASTIAKSTSVADIKAIKDRDEQIAALKAKIAELEKTLEKAQAEILASAETKKPAAADPGKPAAAKPGAKKETAEKKK